MAKKLLYIANDKSLYTSTRLREEAKILGINFDILENLDLKFVLENNKLKITNVNEKINLDDYDIFILREWEAEYIAYGLVTYLISQDKIILNKDYYKNSIGVENKLQQMIVLNKNGIPCVPTKITTSPIDYINNINSSYANELFLKPINGSGGYGAMIIREDKSLSIREMIKQKVWNLMLQKNLDNDHDFRVLILNNKSLGVIKRIKSEGSSVTNYSAGGRAEKSFLNDNIIELCIKAASVLNLDFCGVDVMFDKQNNPYILEVNVTPQFEAFEKYTETNVASSLLQHLIK